MRRLYKIKRKSFWKRGAGELIGYAISMIILLYIFVMVISLTVVDLGYKKMDSALQLIGREIVILDDYDNARIYAEEKAEELLKDTDTLRGVTTNITYVSPAETTWDKGVYITLEIKCYVDAPNRLFSGTRSSYITLMIENGGNTK